jgi:hypothetical protein
MLRTTHHNAHATDNTRTHTTRHTVLCAYTYDTTPTPHFLTITICCFLCCSLELERSLAGARWRRAGGVGSGTCVSRSRESTRAR